MTREPTEMELRVANVLYAVENHGLTGARDMEFATPELREYWLESARAAIRAMRDVGPIAKALPFLVHTGGHGEPKPPHPLVAWAEMIDAASPQEE